MNITPPTGPSYGPNQNKFITNNTTEMAILSTGGTFEKTYQSALGSLGFTESHLPNLKQQCQLIEKTRLEIVMLVDSLDMTSEQRDLLCQRITSAPEDRLIIIHGTDTMVESALLAEKTKRKSQVVVFTGAMVPTSCANSDAIFNLGMAVAAAQLQPPGVWIACSGQVFRGNQVVKDRKNARFVMSSTSQYKTD